MLSSLLSATMNVLLLWMQSRNPFQWSLQKWPDCLVFCDPEGCHVPYWLSITTGFCEFLLGDVWTDFFSRDNKIIGSIRIWFLQNIWKLLTNGHGVGGRQIVQIIPEGQPIVVLRDQVVLRLMSWEMEQDERHSHPLSSTWRNGLIFYRYI